MNKLLLGIAALFLAACGQETTTEPDPMAADEGASGLVSGIDLAAMNTTVRPGDDFFAYVNGTWIQETEMPADKSRYGVFDKLRDESQEAVRVIIEESANGDFPKGSDEQKVGDLYQSFLDWETRDARGIDPLRPELERIDAISDYDELAAYFAGALKRGLDAPFIAQQLPDFLDPNYYAILIAHSGLGLPDREYYFKDDEKSESIRKAYVAHIEKMFDLAGIGDGGQAAQTVMALETRLAADRERGAGCCAC